MGVGLVARTDELDRARGAVADGAGAVVAGEPGVGETALAATSIGLVETPGPPRWSSRWALRTAAGPDRRHRRRAAHPVRRTRCWTSGRDVSTIVHQRAAACRSRKQLPRFPGTCFPRSPAGGPRRRDHRKHLPIDPPANTAHRDKHVRRHATGTHGDHDGRSPARTRTRHPAPAPGTRTHQDQSAGRRTALRPVTTHKRSLSRWCDHAAYGRTARASRRARAHQQS